jgi:eukaryotic-like serine/threonine-protein kinase
MRELEIRLVEGQNSAAVDLFPIRHAEKVLAAFGRAFGSLPERSSEVTRDHKLFLEQAVSGLAQEGKVICVRLALFAEMMKGKSWTPATLKEVGGTEGVGVTFLEETFSAANAPPEHRYHQKAARAVLKTLLPETGTDIKGNMRSYAELLEASGYAGLPKDFDDLVRILDSEIRLITPTDPEDQEKDGDSTSQIEAGQKYYQLTHDYLVPSLRDWLTRKQKETRRGRAELRLAGLAAQWNAYPAKRQLPAWWEWANIRFLTKAKNWTEPQRKMMRKAGRYHAVRAAAMASVLALIGLGSWEGFGRMKAHNLRDRVLEADTSDVPRIVQNMTPYRHWIDSLLRDAYKEAETDQDTRKQLHASLALLPVDSEQVDYLYQRLLKTEPQEVVVIRAALFDHKQDLTERLWTLLENPKNDQDQRFRAASALSVFAPDDPRWEKVAGDVAATLVIQKPFVLAQWTDALRGAGKWLIPPLVEILVDEKRSVSERGLIASVYGTCAADIPDAYTLLEKQLTDEGKPDASTETTVALAKRQASIGVALLIMGRGEKVWPLLRHQPDPTMRSYLIERLGPGGVDPQVLIARLEEEQEVSVKRAILLSLGEYGLDRLSQDKRLNLLPRLLQLYRDDVDSGIHGAAEWLLRQWRASDKLKAIDKDLATGKVEGKRHWYVNGQGQTMMIVSRPGEFWMGVGPAVHRRQIGRSFAIASKEVTKRQFITFRMQHHLSKRYAPEGECPAIGVTWYLAARYCNWLSEKEGIPKQQWCYLPNQADKFEAGMKMAPNYLQRTGYRLPTEAEWEYACRAGVETYFSFGESDEVLSKYAWNTRNSFDQSHPVGSLKPNDLGLYDMHGNAWEWTQDVHKPYAKSGGGRVIDDTEDMTNISITDTTQRVLRGGSFGTDAESVRSAHRDLNVPTSSDGTFGFRLARTLPLGSITAVLPTPEGGRK